MVVTQIREVEQMVDHENKRGIEDGDTYGKVDASMYERWSGMCTRTTGIWVSELLKNHRKCCNAKYISQGGQDEVLKEGKWKNCGQFPHQEAKKRVN